MKQITQQVNNDVLKERERQNGMWGLQRYEYSFWLAILGEEFGEVCQAVQQGSIASKDSDADDLYTELIHVAAVASAIAEQVKEEETFRRIEKGSNDCHEEANAEFLKNQITIDEVIESEMEV